MKVTRYDLDDDENLAAAHVVLTVDELALLYRLTGHVSPLDATEASGGHQRFGEALMDIADAAGSIFNTFYDDGVDDVAPKFGVMEIAARRNARQESR